MSKESIIFVQEFLLRDHDPIDGLPPAWHVVLGERTKSPLTGEPKITLHGPYNMAQAEKLGWGLPKILEAINKTVLIDLEETRLTAAEAVRDAEAAEGKYETERISHQRSLEDHAKEIQAFKERAAQLINEAQVSEATKGVLRERAGGMSDEMAAGNQARRDRRARLSEEEMKAAATARKKRFEERQARRAARVKAA